MDAFRSLCNAAFTVVFLANTIWAAVVMKLISLLPLPQRMSEEILFRIIRLFWRISFAFSPWIDLETDSTSKDEWDALQSRMAALDGEVAAGRAKHKPLFTFANHASFLDVPLFVCVLPRWVLIRSRTYMASFLFNMPVLGTICRTVGHFPVYFNSNEEGKFKLDTEKMNEVEKRVDSFLDDGGYLSFFPEGTVNKAPDRLLPFRHGGMKKALERDARIALFVFYGNHQVWPKKKLIAGYPTCIRYGAKVLAPDGARAYVKKLREEGVSEDERDMPDHALLAKDLQARMQEIYDTYKADVDSRIKRKR